MGDPLLNRYTGRPTVPVLNQEDEADEVEDLGGWGLIRGHRDRALTLELRKKDDTVLAIPYALVEQFLYAPSDGITIRVAGREVHVRGQQLNEPSPGRPLTLFTALCRHRVSWLAERSRAALTEPAPTTSIETVTW